VVDDLSDINDGESTSMGDYDVIIDALFGFSFHGEPREPFATMLQQVMAAQRKADNPPVVVSVDVPSGWNVDEGDVNNSGFVPDVLVSLTTPKLCAQKFITGRHFVGGRFLPPDLATKYKVRMPPYPGISQVMEIPITAVGENNEDQITKQKKVLRKEIRTKMKALSKEEIQEQSVKVWKKVMELHAYKSASSVGIFLSMPSGEINTDFIIEDCIRQGKEIWVPEVGPNFENPDMDLRKVILPDDDGDSSADESKKLFHKVWPTNKWNIPEPPSDMPHVIAKPGDIDLLIVPGLGFDTAGNRLGQGKGYYDRFIAKMNDAASHTKAMPLVAVGLTPQLVLPEHSRIPVASYDKPMDVVIFPDRIIASTDDTNTGEMTTNSNSSRSSRSAERETLSDESWRHEYAAYLAKKYETDNKTSSCVETTHAPSNEQLKIDKDDNDVLGAEKTKPERWEDEYAAHCAEKEERLAKEDAKLREAMRDRG
jgi:5,10-methenyltetrahydrofolate synthetase